MDTSLYRSDRRKLIEFLFSSGLIRTAVGPTTSYSTIDFDSISSDYVVNCIRSGDVLDASQAMQMYCHESSLPVLKHLQSGDAFYLHTDPDSSGSPPHHVPPSIPLENGDSVGSFKQYYRVTERLPKCNGREHVNTQKTKVYFSDSPVDGIIPSLGLPSLRTGLLGDDLRQSAYELFLSCVLFSRPDIHPMEIRKLEKSTKILSILKSRREKRVVESGSTERPCKILRGIRTQMQISESVDAFIRRRLVQLISDNSFEQIDVPKIYLALLTGVSRSDFPAEKYYFNWRNRQANVLEELLSSDNQKSEKRILRAALAKIRDVEEWDFKISTSEKNEVLLTIGQLASAISSMPGKFGLDGETRYWTSCYHLNVRLYEKLLFVLFDILEESQIIEEADDVLKLLKLTWPTLGITERLHHALFSWVLFQQFHATEEGELLEYAVREVESAVSADVCDVKEVAYIRSLLCFDIGSGSETRPNVIQSIFMSISSWCDSKLQDYHLQFDKKTSLFWSVVSMAMHTGTRISVSPGDIQFARSCLPNKVANEKIRAYIESSMNAVRTRVMGLVTNGYMTYDVRHLADLARQLKLIAEKELSVFSPALRHWYPECAMVTAKTLHQYFGEILRPYLEDVTCLTEDISKVLPGAYALECCLIELYSSTSGENFNGGEEFDLYPIAEVSRPIVLDWVVGQQGRILEWVGRALDLEDWEPLSLQKKQAASAIEVFRIIEETVDQFFEWSLPMDITHLQALLSIVFHTLDTYLSKVANQLVEKHSLYPSARPLTRYKEVNFAAVNKNLAHSLPMDDAVYKKLDALTVSKLCIRLNTYQYIKKHLALLEDSIQKSWLSVTSKRTLRYSSIDLNDESVSELFVATLDCIRNSADDALRETIEFIGTKIVFWDMRNTFLLRLYHDSVEGNRLDGVLPQVDNVLNAVCGLIDEPIRDLVVTSIWKASLEGFMWVLLDGGPTRSFSVSDIPLIDEDFNILMDLFVADGEGLPRCMVEEDAKPYRQILQLFSLQTQRLIKMLMDSSRNISLGSSSDKHSQRYSVDSHTLLRILCHRKDREASKFLKEHYKLPPSSEFYETRLLETSNFTSPMVADMIRSASLRWSGKGQSSFRSLKKRLQEASWNER